MRGERLVVAGEAEGAKIAVEEVGAGAFGDREADARESRGQPVALGFQLAGEPGEVGVVLVQPKGHRALQIGRRGEGEELVRLGDRGQQRRRGRQVADLPAGQRKRLARRADAHATLAHAGQRHQRNVGHAVKDDVLVDLVAHHVAVVAKHQIGDQRQLIGGEHLAGGVHRRVQDHQLGVLGESRGQGLGRDPPIGRLEANEAGLGAAAADDGQVGIVERLEQHRFVARLQQRQQARRQCLGGARGHHHLALPVDVEAVEARIVPRHRLAQLGNAEHRRVLVGTIFEGLGRDRAHVGGPIAVGEALAEVDRSMLGAELREDLEDRRPLTGEDRVRFLHRRQHTGQVQHRTSVGAARSRFRWRWR